MKNLLIGIIAVVLLGGCSGGQASPSTTPTTPTTLKAVTQKVTIGGTFASETPNTLVLVNSARATISGSNWSYTANVTGAYTTLKVQIYVNGILTDQHEVSVDTATGN